MSASNAVGAIRKPLYHIAPHWVLPVGASNVA
jgi:hypothetical protein